MRQVAVSGGWVRGMGVRVGWVCLDRVSDRVGGGCVGGCLG